MKTIKKGCKGDEVKTLQKLLGVAVDGDFGPKTEAAVIAFQKAHAKECGDADGIVGPKTWAALGVKETSSTSSKCVDPSVIYAPLTSCITKATNRSIKYLAIHYTAGGSSAPGRAKSMKSGWEKHRRGSADFGVDDRDMVQFNPDLRNYKCWAVGDPKNPYSGGGRLFGIATNTNTISIEICSNLKAGYDSSKVNHAGWYFTEASLDNAVKLAKILMKKFNIPIERVVRHYDISGKICPGVVHWNNYMLYDKAGKRTGMKNDSSQWEAFLERLK
jgi:N-acetyl-anhydromuramyl-L-alanine amidase AmpD